MKPDGLSAPPDPTRLAPACLVAGGPDAREPSRLRRLWHQASGTVMKLVELAIAQGAVYLFPLVFAILCARTLGPAQYGVISFYTALTSFLCLFIEFGLDTIGVREVHSSAHSQAPEQVFWSVTLAKLIICLPTSVLTLSVLLATRNASESSLGYATAIYMIAFALEPSWYLRSLERMRPVLIVAAVSRMAGILLLFMAVTGRDDLAMAMWTYTFVAWASTVVGWLLMGRLHLLGRPRFDASRLHALLRSGAKMIVGNLSGASVTNGGIAVLGMIASPVVTGMANMALRVRSAALGVLAPLMQLGFVRFSAAFGKDRRAGVALGRRLFYVLMLASLALALAIIGFADRIAALVYGLPEAPEAAGVMLRLLAAGLPVHVAGNLFGFQSLTLFEKERAYGIIHLTEALLFFGLLLYFRGHAARYGWTLLAAESWLFVATGLQLRAAVKAL